MLDYVWNSFCHFLVNKVICRSRSLNYIRLSLSFNYDYLLDYVKLTCILSFFDESEYWYRNFWFYDYYMFEDVRRMIEKNL